MSECDDLIAKLDKDYLKLENKIEQYKFYNIRNKIIRLIIKSGLALNYALPFILASFIVLYCNPIFKISPYKLDEVKIYASTQTIETSTGLNLEYTSYDVIYTDKYLKYSTGWTINEDNLYEREETIYQINSKIKSMSHEEIFEMTKEELEDIVDILDIKTIYKSNLEPDDYMFSDSAIIISDFGKSKDDYKIHKETELEDLLEVVGHIALCAIIGSILRNRYIFRIIKDKLKGYASSYSVIDEKDVRKLKQILEIKEENINLLKDEYDKNDNFTYRLRRKNSE